MAATALRPNAPSDSSGPHRIELRGVTAGYGRTPVLEGVSFRIEEPAVYVVLGPNGAGKTTLFRTIAGILQPTSGSVEIDGRDVRTGNPGAQVQYLSHIDGIPDGLRVDEALAFYARVEGASSADIDSVIAKLGISELRTRYLSQLSQGQKKRVSIARVFLRERQIYLLDEPTSNLDPKLAREVRDLVLQASRDDIVLYSSHNLFEAREIGKYVLAIKNGRVGYFGPLSELRAARYLIGVRAEGPLTRLAGWARQGDYFVRELSGPEEVPALVAELVASGARIREVKEMENPLEGLFV